MGNLTDALIIVLSVTAIFLLGGIVATQIRGSDANFISCQGTTFTNCTTYTNNIPGQLPNYNVNTISPSGTSSDSGIFAVIGTWIADTTGLSIIINVISAPYTLLKATGLDTVYAGIIAGIWYTVVLFLVISWWKGQDS